VSVAVAAVVGIFTTVVVLLPATVFVP